MRNYSLLCLGDSYTIGEALPITQSFPYQTIKLLRESGHSFCAPEIIAKTGWTTDELQSALEAHKLLEKYDFVTLLVGVNNQYRGREFIEFKQQYENLLTQAIKLTGNHKRRLILITIPDYSKTPFAVNANQEKIAHEIEVYNSLVKALATQYHVQVLELAALPSSAVEEAKLVAADKLHPSEHQYRIWAEHLTKLITRELS